jgi:hypothetical protein
VKIRGLLITHPLIQDPKRLVPPIPLSFLNHKYNSLVDTGSTISVLSFNVLLKGTKLLPWTEGTILMLDGSETIPLGGYSLEFQLANRKYTHFFAVLRSFEGVLLGMYFLHSCGLVFDVQINLGFFQFVAHGILQTTLDLNKIGVCISDLPFLKMGLFCTSDNRRMLEVSCAKPRFLHI